MCGAVGLAAYAGALRASEPQRAPEIAFTFDDPTTKERAGFPWPKVNDQILATLARHNVHAALFVCGMRIDSSDGQRLIASWDRQRHLVGNHTYSHLNFNEVSLADFEADALKCEPLIRSYARFTRLFRFPYFKEGDTQEKRDGMRALLKAHGYRSGRATIDASDWAVSARLEKRIAESPSADLSAYRDFFLTHIWERAQFYESLAQRALGHSVRHTLLLHHSVLNALFLDDLIKMFKAKSWRVVDASYAYQDPIYARDPQILPAGEGLIWALAKETGRFDAELRYPGEDDTYENAKMDALKL
jgi:peptidoglycan/xylan/chitin deacetylase (PgdA/CDA1 family)